LTQLSFPWGSMDMALFGSSGIRGLTIDGFTPDLAMRIGGVVGTLYGRVILGRDTRTTGQMLERALVAGLTSAGAEVFLTGMVSTPTLAYACRDFNCGLMVTASHNPPEYNGVKMWNPDGSAFNIDQTTEIENRIKTNDYQQAPWERIGHCDRHRGALEGHIRSILEKLGESRIKVVVDCGCGATYGIAPQLLRRKGCEVFALNAQPDGYFPGRSPEPTEEQLGDLRQMVRWKGADLGIAHDGDGDRMLAVDGEGSFVDGDRLLALFASRSSGDIATSIDASMVLDDIVSGVVHRTKVGDAFVSQLMKEKRLEFGGEPSGTFIFSGQGYFPDGIYAAALLSTIVEETPLKEVMEGLPSYPTFRSSFPFSPAKRGVLTSKLGEEMSSLDCDRVLTMDGYRAEFDHGWFLIRLSGTEPRLRLSAEGRNQEDMEEMRDKSISIIRRCLT